MTISLMAAKKCSLHCLLATREGTTHVSNSGTDVNEKLKLRYSEFQSCVQSTFSPLSYDRKSINPY